MIPLFGEALARCSRQQPSLLALQAMSTFNTIASRLGVARLLIEEAQPSFKAVVSKTQADSLRELLREAQLSTDECARVVKSISEIAWHESDGSSLADVVMKRVKQKGTVGGKRIEGSTMQNFVNFIEFFSQSDCSMLMNERMSMNCKSNIVNSLLADLGCRNPDENTSKQAAMLLLMLTNSWENVNYLDAAQKAVGMKEWKKEFKRYVRHLEKPTLWLSTLPPAGLFLKEHPDLASRIYSRSPRMEEPWIDLDKLKFLTNAIKCRNNKQSGNPWTPSAPPGMNGLMRGMPATDIGSLLMQCVQQSQAMMKRNGDLVDLVVFRDRKGPNGPGELHDQPNGRTTVTGMQTGMPALMGYPCAAGPSGLMRSGSLQSDSQNSQMQIHELMDDSQRLGEAQGPPTRGAAALQDVEAGTHANGVKSTVSLMDLLHKRDEVKKATAKAKSATAKPSAFDPTGHDIAAEEPEKEAPQHDGTQKGKKKKMKKKKKNGKTGKKEAILALTNGDDATTPKKRCAVKACAEASSTCKEAPKKPPKKPRSAASGNADPSLQETLSKPVFSVSDTRLEITANTESRRRLCVLSMSVNGLPTKKVARFVAGLKKKIEKGTTKAEVLEERASWVQAMAA